MGMMDMVANMMMQKIKSSPEIQQKIATNPTRKEYLDVLMSGDAQRGEQLANQIMQTYGLSRDTAPQQAVNGLAQMFMAGQ